MTIENLAKFVKGMYSRLSRAPTYDGHAGNGLDVGVQQTIDGRLVMPSGSHTVARGARGPNPAYIL